MKKILFICSLLTSALFGQTAVQKVGGGNNTISNGSIVIGNNTTITTTGNGSISGNIIPTSVPWSVLAAIPSPTLTHTGDVTGNITLLSSGVASGALTLATVNSNIGTFAGITVNGKGLVTAAANLTISTTAPLTGGGTLGNLTLAMPAATTSVNGYLTSTDWTTFNAKQPAGSYITALTGDGTAAGPGSAVFTLAAVATGATTGSSTAIPVITFTNKGLVTAITTAAVIAPAGTLTGTTLASNVITSSLTTVGTIGAGAWQGTVVTGQYGGSGVANTGTTFTRAGNVTFSGAFAFTGTLTGTTGVTFPTSGTLATVAGTVSSITGTANEITASASTGAVTLSLPSALTFTGKTVTGGTFNSGAFNGTVGATSANTGAFTTLTSTLAFTGATGGATSTFGGALTLASANPALTVGDGTGSPAIRIIRSTTASNNAIYWRTASTDNWYLGSGATGTNTNWQLYSYGASIAAIDVAYTTGAVTLNSTTTSSSTSTGALVIGNGSSGGLGVGGAIYAGGFISTGANANIGNSTGIVALSAASSVSGGIPAAWNGNFGVGFQYAGSAVNNMFIGDGTGGSLVMVSRSGSATTTRFTFTDTGSIAITGTEAIGGSIDAGRGLNIASTNLTGTTQYGILSGPVFTSAATTGGNAGYFLIQTAASAFTMVSGISVHVASPSLGAASAITTNYGIKVEDQTAGATNYAFYSGSGKVFHGDTTTSSSTSTGALVVGNGTSGGIGVGGSASIGGNVGIGGSVDSLIPLKVIGNVTLFNFTSGSAIDWCSMQISQTQPTGNGGVGFGFWNRPNVSSGTQTYYVGYTADAGNGTITNYVRFLAGNRAAITGNFAFFSDSTAGTWRDGDTTEATTGGAGSFTTGGGIYAAAKVISGSSFTSGAPSGGTAAAWKMGAHRTGIALAVSTTDGVQLDVGGTLYTLATLTTNP